MENNNNNNNNVMAVPSSYYSIEIKNVQSKLGDIVNESGLPFSVLLLILNNLVSLIEGYADKEYHNDLDKYNQEMEEYRRQTEVETTVTKEEEETEVEVVDTDTEEKEVNN